jgi:hypothetical protein
MSAFDSNDGQRFERLMPAQGLTGNAITTIQFLANHRFFSQRGQKMGLVYAQARGESDSADRVGAMP